jgi:class 3 adenylate cyclase
MSSESPSARHQDRPATVLFADVLGFAELAHRRGPDEAFAIVTRCLRRLDEIARRHGGAVDKYLGDCLMAVFGFPVASARAEEETVAAAEEMLRAVDDTRRELDLGEGFAVRIGANTGEILAGKLGGTVIREFAVIGDAVNVAARLKDLAPPGRAWAPPAVTAWTTTATTAPTGTVTPAAAAAPTMSAKTRPATTGSTTTATARWTTTGSGASTSRIPTAALPTRTRKPPAAAAWASS